MQVRPWSWLLAFFFNDRKCDIFSLQNNPVYLTESYEEAAFSCVGVSLSLSLSGLGDTPTLNKPTNKINLYSMSSPSLPEILIILSSLFIHTHHLVMSIIFS